MLPLSGDAEDDELDSWITHNYDPVHGPDSGPDDTQGETALNFCIHLGGLDGPIWRRYEALNSFEGSVVLQQQYEVDVLFHIRV